jgi:2-polyprenyl-3-methyl-5-hydroxy-6-metoxy-1,4-benzoquinol methylase
MEEKLSKCPLCKSVLFLNDTQIEDYSVSHEKFKLSKCSNCELKFTNPRPTQNDIAPYYDFPEYYSHEDKISNITQAIYSYIRKYAVNSKVELFNTLKPTKGNLLDYGCGTGELVAKAKSKGWNVEGVEPNDKARNYASDKTQITIKKEFESTEQTYDVISLFHVLEHIHELRKTIKKLVTNLKSGGYIIIAVPNPESFDAKKYGNHWAGWDVPRHLYHFNGKSMKIFATEFGLELENVLPMKFDSYYVSLLSEGYQNPKQPILVRYWKSFITGRKSNSIAATQNNNYSSKLYLFKKK